MKVFISKFIHNYRHVCFENECWIVSTDMLLPQRAVLSIRGEWLHAKSSAQIRGIHFDVLIYFLGIPWRPSPPSLPSLTEGSTVFVHYFHAPTPRVTISFGKIKKDRIVRWIVENS